MAKPSSFDLVGTILGGLATLFLGLQTAFPKYDITSEITLTQYEALFVVAILAWAFWAIWLIRKYRKQRSQPSMSPPGPKTPLLDFENTEGNIVIGPKAPSEWGPLIKDKGSKGTTIINPEGLPSKEENDSENAKPRNETSLSTSKKTDREERSVRHPAEET